MSTNLRQAVSLALGTNLSNREIGREVGIAFNSVRRYRAVAKENGYELDALLKLDDETLHTYFSKRPLRHEDRRMPDWNHVHAQLQRRHVTLQLLWENYLLEDPQTAYRYSQFTYYYRQWERKQGLSMRQQHAPGERGWVDFAGPTMTWIDRDTGEEHHVQVFVAALGISHYLFAMAVPAQTSEWWIEAHRCWYEFLGGVPAITITDNLKAAVIRAGSDPLIHPTYLEMGRHYNTVILPTRPRKPKDKGKVEGGVLIFERWGMAPLRDRIFHSLAEINVALRERLDAINARTMRVYNASRQARFDEIDRPHLKPLPDVAFAYGDWLTGVRVRNDYHVEIQGHFYSVPNRLMREQVNVRVSAGVIECFYRRERVASHVRSHVVGGTTTDPAHQPDNHKAWSQHTPDRYRAWAITIGAHALAVIEHQFASAAHPTLALKACSGLQGLAKTYSAERFEAACGEALRIKSPNRKSIRSLLQNNLDQRRRDAAGMPEPSLPLHHNVRGPNYYRAEETTHAD
jgi:transposase